MFTTTSEAGTRFHLRLAEWAALSEVERQSDRADAIEDDLWHLMESNQVARSDVIQSMAHLLKDAPNWHFKYCLLYYMQRMEDRGFHYPEFFWIVLNSDVLFEVNDISDVAMISRLLQTSGGADALRAYLIVTLLTSASDSRRRNAARAFYPVGHTLTTLRIVDSVFKDTQDSVLRNQMYLNALPLLSQDGPLPFTDSERAYLRDFFGRGLSLPYPRTVLACQEAIQRLASLD